MRESRPQRSNEATTPASPTSQAPLDVLAPTTPPAGDFDETGPRVSGVLVLVLSLFVLGLLLVSASAVPPARVPWPVVSESLYLHRSDLAVVGIGAFALGLLCLNVAVLL